VVIGAREAAGAAFEMGAQRVIWLGELPEGWMLEDAIPTLTALVQKSQPYGVLIGATTRGRVVSGRLAARLGTAALTDVLEFSYLESVLQARHMAFGGGAVRADRPTIGPIIATIGPGIFEPLPMKPDAGGEIEPAEMVNPSWRAKLIERRARESASVNLPAADRVVCAGRGLKQQEDWS